MLQVFTTVITLTNTAHRAHVLRRHCMGPRVRLHFKTYTMYIDTAKECNTGPYTEILLKVALNTITLTLYNYISFVVLFICNLHCINPVVVFWFMVFNATFNNISVISWWSVLLVEEIRVPGENNRPVASHRQTLSHKVVSSTPRHERGLNSLL